MEKIGQDKITLNSIKKTLTDTQPKKSFGIAPPEYLVLMNVEYDNIKFTQFKKTQKNMEELTQYYHMRAMMFENISNTPKY
jgi:tRNA U38,U39,U40 pseudouridine synthase TruA